MLTWPDVRKLIQANAALGAPKLPRARDIHTVNPISVTDIHPDILDDAYLRWAAATMMPRCKSLIYIIKNGNRTKAPQALFSTIPNAAYPNKFARDAGEVKAILSATFPFPFFDWKLGKVDTETNLTLFRQHGFVDAAYALDRWHGADVLLNVIREDQIIGFIEEAPGIETAGKSEEEIQSEQVSLILRHYREGLSKPEIKAKLGDISHSQYKRLRERAAEIEPSITKAGRPPKDPMKKS